VTVASTTALLLCFLLAQSPDQQHADDASTEELVIASDSQCPSTDAVRTALTKLRPPPEWPDAEISIHAAADALTIEIESQSSVRRQIAVALDCGERATSAALVIATWMDELPAEEAGAPTLHASAATSPASPPRLAHYEAGAGLTSAFAGDWAPGLRAELVRLHGEDLLSWQASLDLVGPHEVAAGQRATRWMRAGVAGGAQIRRSFERFFLAADMGLAGALTVAWGTGYAEDRSDHSFTWGPVAGARAGISWGRFLLWLDLRGHWWARGDSVRIDSPSAAWVDNVDLPSWDAQGSVGVSRVLD
jgi:hypothetical protein